MKNIVPDVVIVSIVTGSFLIIYFTVNIFYDYLAADSQQNLTLSQLIEQVPKEYTWSLRLTINCIGYAGIIVPGVVIYKYVKRIHYLERPERNFLYSVIKSCFGENEKFEPISTSSTAKSASRALAKECVLLTYCFLGLMGSYLTWGVLQEKIMTKEYISVDGKTKSFFKDSQFLVFSNRFLAFIISAIYTYAKQQSRQKAPLFKYSYASFSNIMSAWLQYEALKFISFPTQVLAKSCKIIPVMLMGKIISRNKYEFYEYIVAVSISIGMILFLSGSYDQSKHTPITTLTGLFLLVLYMVFDSFTSNWQSEIFKTYKISSVTMMCGVNLFSSLFTVSSLLVQGGFSASFTFSSQHPNFFVDCIILSISSAIGQLFIFYTIANFGAVVFTIIMTLRQAIAILLSCLIYHHNISTLGIIGIFIVFFAIFLRVYCSHRIKVLRRKHELLKQRLNV